MNPTIPTEVAAVLVDQLIEAAQNVEAGEASRCPVDNMQPQPDALESLRQAVIDRIESALTKAEAVVWQARYRHPMPDGPPAVPVESLGRDAKVTPHDWCSDRGCIGVATGDAEECRPFCCKLAIGNAESEARAAAIFAKLEDMERKNPLPPKPAEPVASVPDGYVLAPHFRGFAHLGIGRYRLFHSRLGVDAELSIVPATPEEVDGRVVGDLRDDGPDEIPAELMAVRLRFENVAGLDALEQQLRLLRETHFSAPPTKQEGAAP